MKYRLLREKIKNNWGRSDSNTQPSDLESDALPLRHAPKAILFLLTNLEIPINTTKLNLIQPYSQSITSYSVSLPRERLKSSLSLLLRRPLLVLVVRVLISWCWLLLLIGRIVRAKSVPAVVVFIVVSIVIGILCAANDQVPLQQSQVLSFEHAIGLECNDDGNDGEYEKDYQHGRLEPVAILAAVVTVREPPSLYQVTHGREVSHTVVEHNYDVEYHEAEVHRLSTTHKDHRIEELIDTWETDRWHEGDRHYEVRRSQKVQSVLHFPGKGWCMLVLVSGSTPHHKRNQTHNLAVINLYPFGLY